MESQDHSCQRNIYSRQIEKGEDRMEQVNPVLVPERKLSDGMVIPGIGMGTFGNDRYSSGGSVRRCLRRHKSRLPAV